MEHWDEIWTACWVARLGTVSAAAAKLGIHRATVVRHIDTLEAELGGKLFQRHARGYVMTEAGQDLLRVASTVEEQLHDLAGRTRGRTAEVSGELVVTSIELIAPLVLPALRAFREQYPDTIVRYEASARVYRLEYGEAHVALRTGARPEHPDNVVQPWLTLRSGLYAHRHYIARHGLPASPDDVEGHTFISDATPGSPMIFARWLQEHAPNAPVAFSSANGRLNSLALAAGMGIAFCPQRLARLDPELVEVHPPLPAWDIPVWLVTHVDLHRTPKVQAILRHLRTTAAEPEDPDPVL